MTMTMSIMQNNTTTKPLNKTNMTAVDWLVQQLNEHIKKSAHNKLGTIRTGDYRIGLRKAIDFCEQAKEMEKEQIMNSWVRGVVSENNVTAEQYYNQTYKQD